MFKNPDNLYDICINIAVTTGISQCKYCRKEFRCMPNNVLFDFYYRLFLKKSLCLLSVEFGELDVFYRLLCIKHQRVKLLKMFQSVIDHATDIPDKLVLKYSKNIQACSSDNPQAIYSIVDMGLRMGAFFNEAGAYDYTIDLLDIVENFCKKHTGDVVILRKLLDCYYRRINAEAVYGAFKAANKTFNSAEEVVKVLEGLNALPNLSGLYTAYSMLFFLRSEYRESSMWAEKALRLLNDELPPRIIIETLRQASKSCVIKRRFNQASLLIRQAVNLALTLYAVDNHPNLSDTLLDYGFYLLNFDSIEESVKVYEEALRIREEVFQKNNILVALGHEDLAYSLYVNEYSSGRFYNARSNAERSIRIMERILPTEHLMLASVKRVKALILEEIALDERHNPELKWKYLLEAEELHKEALALSLRAFGEKNVLTAKHYGNLGRLYQSMKQYEKSEKMHLKAIAIKEELLGEDDNEVGLSIGHLASLYNYHMKRHKDAEGLYLRSIKINLNLFGEAYSGLEYDYRGLIQVYTKLQDASLMIHYTSKMRQWKFLREEIRPVVLEEELLPLNEVIEGFFRMCETKQEATL